MSTSINKLNETTRDDFEKALEVIVNHTVTADELADILRISKSAVCKWAKQKRFPSGSVVELGCTRRYVVSRILRAGLTNYSNRRAER